MSESKHTASQAHLRTALGKIADMIDDENADLDDAIDIARSALSTAVSEDSHMFEIDPGFELEAVASGRPEWIIPVPAPKCKLAIRKDTKEWFVATGVYYKTLESIDGILFRDSDGCTWRLLSISPKATLSPPTREEGVRGDD
jgi:hypothetical protein